MKKRDEKKAIVSDYLPWLLIGIAILVILTLAIFILSGKGTEFIDKIKNIFGGR
jgi:hypothetical protein